MEDGRAADGEVFDADPCRHLIMQDSVDDGGHDARDHGFSAIQLQPSSDDFADRKVTFCQCTLELENASGAKMRVHLQGAEVPDLAGIVRGFRDYEP